jgi:RNA polymerase sigma-70 factor (ECF subfamily)
MMGMRRGATLDQLRDVYERRLPQLRRVAVAIVGDRELGYDAVQEAFVRAVRMRSSFGASGTLDAWVWRIVVNAARDARARVRQIDGGAPVEDAVPDADLDQRQAVRRAVEALPERQRLVLFLRVYADLDYRAIAAAVGISEGTVGATLNAAHAHLRQALAEVRS